MAPRPDGAIRSVCLAAWSAVLFAAGCASAPIPYNVHYSLLDAPARPVPRTVVLLEPRVRVYETSFGGVTEEVPEWSEQARRTLRDAVLAYAGGRPDLVVLPPPELGEAERATVDEYTALYEVVASNAHVFTHLPDPDGEPWKHKVTHFDYTLGPGLDTLADSTGADAALFVVGAGRVDSVSRKLKSAFSAILGMGPAGGNFRLTTGVVDLRTGDLLWLDIADSKSHNYTDPDGARAMVERLLDDFPGVDEYRKRYGGG